MKRSEAVRYARALSEHPDTDPGIREFAQAYLDLDALLVSWARLILDREDGAQ